MTAILTRSLQTAETTLVQATSLQQVLLDYITQFAQLNQTEAQKLLEMVKIREFPKGAILLREGQVGKHCYFVLKGCVRQYYLLDGAEKTVNFFTEGQPVTATGFPYDEKPSKCYLVCNEACILIFGMPEDEAAFFEKMPQFADMSRIGVEYELKKSQEALADFITSSPEARYRSLLATRPELLDRVPQYQLASYLGITPESLSRIRKRIMGK